MISGVPKAKNTLISFSKSDLAEHPAFAVLAKIRGEDVWLANFSSQNTKDAYRRAVGSFIATVGITSPQDLYAVKLAHVIAWRTAMEQAGFSQASISSKLAALSSLFRHLTDAQLAASNPVTGIRRPKTGNAGTGAGKSPTLSKKQVRAMLDSPDVKTEQGRRDRALLHVFFYAGARCSEPASLKVKDFTFDGDFPIRSLTIKGNKTNTVAINIECATAIREYLDQAEHSRDPEAYLFQPLHPRDRHKPLDRKTLYRVFDKYARRIGLDTRAFPHMARATMITHAYEAGATGEAIQRTVGHSSITTTEGYNHTAQKHRDSASLKIGY